MLSWFDILPRAVLAGNKYCSLVFICHHFYGEKICGQGPLSFLRGKKKKNLSLIKVLLKTRTLRSYIYDAPKAYSSASVQPVAHCQALFAKYSYFS